MFPFHWRLPGTCFSSSSPTPLLFPRRGISCRCYRCGCIVVINCLLFCTALLFLSCTVRYCQNYLELSLVRAHMKEHRNKFQFRKIGFSSENFSRKIQKKNILACLASRPPATIRMLSTWTFPEQLGSLPSKKCGRSNRSRSLSGPGSAPQEAPVLNACNLACRRYFGVLVPLVRRVCRPLPDRSMT